MFNGLPMSGGKPTFFFGQQTVNVMTTARQNRQWLGCPGLIVGRLVDVHKETTDSAKWFG